MTQTPTPDFAMSFTTDTVRLERREEAGWHDLGSEPFAGPDLGARLAQLAGTADMADMTAQPTTMIIIPDEQVLYTTLTVAPGLEPPEAVARALDGLTPYPVADLAFDWAGTDDGHGDSLRVAAVARRTLQEAEDFACEHGFRPVGFTARPAPAQFPRQPDFGISAEARPQRPARRPVALHLAGITASGIAELSETRAAAPSGGPAISRIIPHITARPAGAMPAAQPAGPARLGPASGMAAPAASPALNPRAAALHARAAEARRQQPEKATSEPPQKRGFLGLGQRRAAAATAAGGAAAVAATTAAASGRGKRRGSRSVLAGLPGLLIGLAALLLVALWLLGGNAPQAPAPEQATAPDAAPQPDQAGTGTGTATLTDQAGLPPPPPEVAAGLAGQEALDQALAEALANRAPPAVLPPIDTAPAAAPLAEAQAAPAETVADAAPRASDPAPASNTDVGTDAGTAANGPEDTDTAQAAPDAAPARSTLLLSRSARPIPTPPPPARTAPPAPADAAPEIPTDPLPFAQRADPEPVRLTGIRPPPRPARPASAVAQPDPAAANPAPAAEAPPLRAAPPEGTVQDALSEALNSAIGPTETPAPAAGPLARSARPPTRPAPRAPAPPEAAPDDEAALHPATPWPAPAPVTTPLRLARLGQPPLAAELALLARKTNQVAMRPAPAQIGASITRALQRAAPGDLRPAGTLLRQTAQVTAPAQKMRRTIAPRLAQARPQRRPAGHSTDAGPAAGHGSAIRDALSQAMAPPPPRPAGLTRSATGTPASPSAAAPSAPSAVSPRTGSGPARLSRSAAPRPRPVLRGQAVEGAIAAAVASTATLPPGLRLGRSALPQARPPGLAARATSKAASAAASTAAATAAAAAAAASSASRQQQQAAAEAAARDRQRREDAALQAQAEARARARAKADAAAEARARAQAEARARAQAEAEARAAAARKQAYVPPEAEKEPDAPNTKIPKGRSPAKVAAAATVKDGISLNRTQIIGTIGAGKGSRALVRLSSGKVITLRLGDKINGGTITAIGNSNISYMKGGRTRELPMLDGR